MESRVESSSLIGQVLQGTYRIERLIGEGGMGAVYEASHLRLLRRFAIKMLFPQIAKHAEAVARFKREALVTSALGHPHILEVTDFNHTEDGVPYLVMELLDGEDLFKRLGRVKGMPLEQTASIFLQAADALSAAHQHHIVHRDLKPHNLFLCNREGRDDFVKVVDFGISKVLGSKSMLTTAQSLIGTPVYMTPEQAEEKAALVDHRTDIYAMGTVLFEMLASQLPFHADSLPTLLYKIAHEKAPRLRSLRPDLPASLEEVVGRALEKKPEDRFQSMSEFAQAFVCALEKAGPEARPRITINRPPVSTQTGPVAPQTASTLSAAAGQQLPEEAPQRNRNLFLGGLAVAVLGVGAIASLLLLHGAQRQRRVPGPTNAIVPTLSAPAQLDAAPAAGEPALADPAPAATPASSEATPAAPSRDAAPKRASLVKRPRRQAPSLKRSTTPVAPGHHEVPSASKVVPSGPAKKKDEPQPTRKGWIMKPKLE